MAVDAPLKVLSIRAPWWWWIINGSKDIENRDWPTKYRGPVLIHASSWYVRGDVEDDHRTSHALHVAKTGIPYNLEHYPDGKHNDLRAAGGHIVGIADIVDCVSASDSPWFFGDYGFVLANARPLPKAIPFKARLGLFDAPAAVLAAYAAQTSPLPTPTGCLR